MPSGTERPLAGRRVIVTRAAAQSGPLLARLRALGADVIAAPAIRVVPPEDAAALHAAAANLQRFSWVLFTSSNAVRAVCSARDAQLLPAVWPPSTRVAAVGSATAKALADAGIPVAFQPTSAVAEALARELPVDPGATLLWPHGNLAAPALAEALSQRQAKVTSVVAYRTEAATGLLDIADSLREAGPDAITFTSASTVRHFVDGLSQAGIATESLLGRARPLIVCIGPVTAAAARECGLPVDRIADPSTDEGLVEALLSVFTPRPATA